jgi:vacuolar-type H+-ATPase subunit I/STV1
MKKLILILATAIFTLPSVAGDGVKIKVESKNEKINGGNHPCLVVTIYDAKPNDIESAWKSKMKDYDAKVSGKDEIFADNALIKSISENTCDVYAYTEKINDNETKFVVGFLLGETWIDSKSPSYNAAEKIVKDFAVAQSKEGIAEKRKAAEKLLDDQKDDQADLEKKNKNLHDDITDYNEKIKKAEDDIKSNEDAQAKKKAEIDAQQKVVDDLKSRENSVE